MPLVQPETFTLTQAEAATVQSVQMERQAKIARQSPVLLAGSIAAPFIVAAALYACDLIWFDGAMPGWLFVTLMGVFVAGMLTQTAALWLNLMVAKRLMREKTRQVFDPRTVKTLKHGIEQEIPTAMTRHKWSGIDRVELRKDIIFVWAGNILACSIPERAFPSTNDAKMFLEECLRRIGSGSDH